MTEQGSSQEPNQSPAPSDSTKSDALPMPPTQGPDSTETREGGEEATAAVDLPPPPRFGLQLAQLVIIPLLIVAAAVGVSLLFGKLASVEESTANLVRKLEQSSGGGKMIGGVQDPRYKDRWLAAFNIAARIPQIEDAQQRRSLSNDLVRILNDNVGDDEGLLQLYLLPAIGQLGQPGGLEAITERLDADDPRVQQGAVRGVLSWPDREAAKTALPAVIAATKSQDPVVQREAAVTVGALAAQGDATAIAALHDLLDRTATQGQEAHWNAATALACLGDERGSKYVADVLLTRATLAKIRLEPNPDSPPPPSSETGMPRAAQDRVILSTLASAERMHRAIVWNKIRTLADEDESLSVRKAALHLLGQRKQSGEPSGEDG